LRQRPLSGLGYPLNQARPANDSTLSLPAVQGSNHCSFGDSLM
jgi:hypothetical protein